MKTRTPERIEFLNDVLTTAIEGGMTGYWAKLLHIKRDDELNIIKVTLVAKDEAEDVDSILANEMTESEYYGLTPKEYWDKAKAKGLTVHKVTVDTIAKGLGMLSRNEHDFVEQCGKGEFKLANRTNGDDGDYDAVDADCVLQLGLFGKTIYG